MVVDGPIRRCTSSCSSGTEGEVHQAGQVGEVHAAEEVLEAGVGAEVVERGARLGGKQSDATVPVFLL